MSDLQINENNAPQYDLIYQPLIVRNDRPNDYMAFSIINAFCCFLGFIPLIYSLQSRDDYYLGEFNKAAEKSKMAKGWNIIVLVLSLVIFILVGLSSYIPSISTAISDNFIDNYNNTYSNP